MSKKVILVVISSMLLVTAVSFGVTWWYHSSEQSNSLKQSAKTMQDALQTMTGVKNADQLPLKTAADQKPLVPTIAQDGTKQFTLTAEPIRWEYQKGKSIVAWAFNGQVPGPEIRVTEGDKVRITFTNKLPRPTTIHWHGLDLPNSMDGVPGVTQAAVKPGETFTYEFTATPAGTRFYHTHGSGVADEAQQSDMGLSGAFIVEPKGYVKPDKEYTVVLDDWLKGEGSFNNAVLGMDQTNGGMSMNMNYNLFTMNGLAYPDTTPLTVKKGDKVRIRIINASASTSHPMHLHGQQFKIVAIDGNPVPVAAQLTRNVVTVNPGETYDIEFTATNEGIWAFHCHELHHSAAGMMTLLKYDGYIAPMPTPPVSPAGSSSQPSMPGMNM